MDNTQSVIDADAAQLKALGHRAGSTGRCRTGGFALSFPYPSPVVGVYTPFGTAFSAGGHPVSAAIALGTLRIIRERNLVAQAAEVGAHLQRRLREFAR